MLKSDITFKLQTVLWNYKVVYYDATVADRSGRSGFRRRRVVGAVGLLCLSILLSFFFFLVCLSLLGFENTHECFRERKFRLTKCKPFIAGLLVWCYSNMD
jgi:hypothetical protein